jgi:ABC-type transport system substrate-binding protein
MAERVGGRLLEEEGARGKDFEPLPSATAFMFQYLIGNTDVQMNRLHNGEIVAVRGMGTVPVPYDFDFAGAINAPYASPLLGLRIKNVRMRQFIGYCYDQGVYATAAERFRERKAAIYALYADVVGVLVPPDVVKQTLGYFDEFYRDIATPKDVNNRLVSDCVAG